MYHHTPIGVKNELQRAAARLGHDRCLRCDIRLTMFTETIECGLRVAAMAVDCDALCPAFGYAGHLWQDDEAVSLAAFEQFAAERFTPDVVAEELATCRTAAAGRKSSAE